MNTVAKFPQKNKTGRDLWQGILFLLWVFFFFFFLSGSWICIVGSKVKILHQEDSEDPVEILDGVWVQRVGVVVHRVPNLRERYGDQVEARHAWTSKNTQKAKEHAIW